MSERSGVEIDYCPDCRGVWLDRGELDKILDRVAAEAPAPAPAAAPPQQERYSEPRREQYPPQQGNFPGGQRQYRKKKKEHWLMEMFD